MVNQVTIEWAAQEVDSEIGKLGVRVIAPLSKVWVFREKAGSTIRFTGVPACNLLVCLFRVPRHLEVDVLSAERGIRNLEAHFARSLAITFSASSANIPFRYGIGVCFIAIRRDSLSAS